MYFVSGEKAEIVAYDVAFLFCRFAWRWRSGTGERIRRVRPGDGRGQPGSAIVYSGFSAIVSYFAACGAENSAEREEE